MIVSKRSAHESEELDFVACENLLDEHSRIKDPIKPLKHNRIMLHVDDDNLENSMSISISMR